MGFLKKLFGGTAQAPIRPGDKVRDLRGNVFLVTAVTPNAKGGPDTLRLRDARAREFSAFLIGNEYSRVDAATPLATAPSQFERITTDTASAGVYLRGSSLGLHGWCQTNSGNLMCEPYVPLAADATDAGLGTALLSVLKNSVSTPIPEDLKVESQKLFKLFGVRSWSKLYEGAVHCRVQQSPQLFSFTPTRMEGKASYDLSDRQIQIPAQSSSEEIGKSLRQCLQLCL